MKRGLRDVDGVGVLAGLTNISCIQSSEMINGEKVPCEGNVELEHVDFSYVKEVPLIQDFNLKVEPGQRIAIVGPTGCGKTTLINLLMRFYDVNVGMIKVEGNDIRDVTRESLRSSYGIVPGCHGSSLG